MSELRQHLRPLLDDFARQQGLPPDAAKHMRDAIGSSPMLMQFMSGAIERGHLQSIRLSPTYVNAGGHYDAKDKTIYINEQLLIPSRAGSQRRNSIDQMHDSIVAILGHETSHAFGAGEYQQAASKLDAAIVEAIRAAGSSEQREVNLTPPVEAFIDTVRAQEAEAERAGWNALASRAYHQNDQKLNVYNLAARASPTTDCVNEPQPQTYVLAPDLELGPDGRISASQREAVAQCHFDAPRAALGQDGNANYRNYYATFAIERIEGAVRDWRNAPEVRLDLQRLGLDPDQIRGAGVSFGKTDRSVSVLDPATGIVTFEHNKAVSSHATPDLRTVFEQPQLQRSTDTIAPLRDPAHPDHALHRNVQQAVQARLPEGAPVSEDRLAQLTLAAKQARFGPGEHIEAFVGKTTVSLRGEHPTHLTQVDLATPPPTAQQSAQQAVELDRQQARHAEQYASRQTAEQQNAPVMQH